LASIFFLQIISFQILGFLVIIRVLKMQISAWNAQIPGGRRNLYWKNNFSPSWENCIVPPYAQYSEIVICFALLPDSRCRLWPVIQTFHEDITSLGRNVAQEKNTCCFVVCSIWPQMVTWRKSDSTHPWKYSHDSGLCFCICSQCLRLSQNHGGWKWCLEII